METGKQKLQAGVTPPEGANQKLMGQACNSEQTCTSGQPLDLKVTNVVVPAKAGTHVGWIPAGAGMTFVATERSEESLQLMLSGTAEILRFAQNDSALQKENRAARSNGLPTQDASGVSQEFVEYISPRSGRQHVAHGVSRGVRGARVPSPAWAGEGCRRQGEGRLPQGLRPGVHASAPGGAAETPPDHFDLYHESPGQGASFHFPVSNFCFLLSAFCLLLSSFCFGADPGTAEALIEAGHWKRARAIVEPGVAANPRDAQAAWLLSRIRLAFGDLDSALKFAQQAVALEDGNSDYHFQLADVYGEMASRASMFAAASLARKFKGELDASLARNPKNLDALDALMQYSYQAPGMMGGDKGKARAIAEELVGLDPVRGYLAQAELAKEARDFAKVEECFLKAVQADARSFEAQTALARFYTQPLRRNTEVAGKHAREAVELKPARAKGYSILASVLAYERRWSDLEAVLSASEKAVPDDLAPYYEAANAMLESGVELKRGEAYLRKYLAQEPEGGEPDRAQAHRLLGLILEKQGRKAEAVSELATAVQMNPRFKAAKDDLKRVESGAR